MAPPIIEYLFSPLNRLGFDLLPFKVNPIHPLQFGIHLRILKIFPGLCQNMLPPLMNFEIALNALSFPRILKFALSPFDKFLIFTLIKHFIFDRAHSRTIEIRITSLGMHFFLDHILKLSLFDVLLPMTPILLCIFDHNLILSFELLLDRFCFVAPFLIIVLVQFDPVLQYPSSPLSRFLLHLIHVLDSAIGLRCKFLVN